MTTATARLDWTDLDTYTGEIPNPADFPYYYTDGSISDLPIYSEIELTPEQVAAYVDRGRQYYGKGLRGISLLLDDDPEYVKVLYDYHFPKFDRITGYLVGTLVRFNDAKRAEEQDRVKHAVGSRKPEA